MMSYPLLRHFQPDSVLAWRNGRSVTMAQFLGAAVELAARLPAKRYVLNLCEDRYGFLLGFAAALLARQISLMPPSRAEDAVRQVYRCYPDTYCLMDYTDAPSGLAGLSLAKNPSGAGACATTPTFPGDQVAAITFTSGSTGRPLAHVKTWESLIIGAGTLGKQLGVQPGVRRVVLGTVPPQHMYGLETTVMFPLQWGVTIHAGRPVLPADLRSALEDLPSSSWLMTTPIHLRACVAGGMKLPGLEGVISATMPLLPELAREAEAMWRVPIHEIYGCTEAGMIAMRRTAAGEIWKVCRGMRIWQEDGHVWVQGRHVAQPLRLADRISVLNEQEFILHGPAGDLVKVAGKRASLQALNAELNRIAGVLDGSFYLPEGTDTGSERLTAFVVAPGLTASAILTQLHKRIDPVFLPRPLCLVKALPRSATGKLPRESLGAFAARRFAHDSGR